MNTLRPAEETSVDQGKDGQTNNHEVGPQWGGLHPAAAAAGAATAATTAAAAAAVIDDDDDDDRVTVSRTDTAC